MNQGNRFRGRGASARPFESAAYINVSERPIRGCELIDVRELFEEIRYIKWFVFFGLFTVSVLENGITLATAELIYTSTKMKM